ncbi:MAG: Rrf2 family nitric oxide-sensitive transcriptional repressor [Motiliproteus sp.]|jgi:Rrf2 family nitric oxide-sensitive transcriptional repressor
MQLTKYTDYALRTLIFVALQKPAQRVTISNVSEHFDVPRNHLVKIVNHLGKLGYIETVRGKGGGIRLARPATNINLRDVIEATEETLIPIDCQKEGCRIRSACRLSGIMAEAQEAFMGVFGRYHISDLVDNPERLEQLLKWYPLATN